jgi:ATP-dependent RNA helicase DeaD
VDPSKLTQYFYDIPDNLKYSLLVHLLEKESARLVMVFCNTRKNVDFVANNLKFNGIDALPIHGGFSQEKRNRIMDQFHGQRVKVLICTDVAARGLDIKGVSHVYNYDIPADSKEYIHRIGRTARAGKEGKVINLVSSRDYENFNNVIRNDELNIQKEQTPYLQRVRIRWMPEKKSERFARRRSMENERRGFGRSSGSRRNSNPYDKRGHNQKSRRNSFHKRY